MFSGLDVFFFFRLRRDPIFLFANNTKRIVELFLSWIFFSGKLGHVFYFSKNLHAPHKNQMVAPLRGHFCPRFYSKPGPRITMLPLSLSQP